jgi:hypothetical protein
MLGAGRLSARSHVEPSGEGDTSFAGGVSGACLRLPLTQAFRSARTRLLSALPGDFLSTNSGHE